MLLCLLFPELSKKEEDGAEVGWARTAESVVTQHSSLPTSTLPRALHSPHPFQLQQLEGGGVAEVVSVGTLLGI